MRFFLATLLPFLALVSAKSIQQGFVQGSNENALFGRRELPLGTEYAQEIRGLSNFNQAKFGGDKITRYEVNPDFDFDDARSLDVKMTPILNFQKASTLPSSYLPEQQGKQGRAVHSMHRGQHIMNKLLGLGILPSTVKLYFIARRQGLVGSGNAVSDMLSIQDGSLQIPASFASSSLDEDEDFATMSEEDEAAMLEKGVVIPNEFAILFKNSPIVISTTVNNQPAIEVKHFRRSLLNCAAVENQSTLCVKLVGLVKALSGTENTHLYIVKLTEAINEPAHTNLNAPHLNANANANASQ